MPRRADFRARFDYADAPLFRDIDLLLPMLLR